MEMYHSDFAIMSDVEGAYAGLSESIHRDSIYRMTYGDRTGIDEFTTADKNRIRKNKNKRK